MVPDIQSETDRIFCHSWPFSILLPPICPTNDPKKSEFWKQIKKNCLDILSFYVHMYTINEHHIIYGFWNVRCDRQKFLSFWVNFCPFSPQTTQKIKILKLKKSPGNIIILHICAIHDNHIIYVSWDMEYNRQNFCHFGPFFALLPPPL